MRFLPMIVATMALVIIQPGLTWAAHPMIEIRVVVVTTWEYEPDGKDLLGELHAWRTRWPLATTMPFPTGAHTLHYDPKTHVLAVVTGMAAARATASIMALGLDPRFDFSHAYWVIAGIAGVDPKIASIGSAAWERWIVDGDLSQEIDLRDAPPGWSTGIVPLGRTEPYQSPKPPNDTLGANIVYPLNAGLADWAFGLTRAVTLADDPKITALRAQYSGEAAKPPFTFEGDGLISARFWYGEQLNLWAERWVDYWTGGKGVFAMSAEEDSGIMQALVQLADARRIRLDRVLALRTASDYTVGPPGQTAGQLLAEEAKSLPGMDPALENLYRVGAPVVRYLTDHWESTREKVPGN